jgi:hypothetical protein
MEKTGVLAQKLDSRPPYQRGRLRGNDTGTYPQQELYNIGGACWQLK